MDSASVDNVSDVQLSPRKTSKPQKAKPGRASPGIWGHSIQAITIAGLGLIAAMALVWWQLVQGSNQAHVTAQVNTYKASFAAYFNGRITALEAHVKSMAASQQVLEAVTASDPQTRRATAVALASTVAFAKRIEVVPKGEVQVDLNAAVPISYAAVDLIKRAESKEFVGPESAVLDQRSYIYAASPIINQGAVAGVLFVALSPDYFLTPLKAFDPRVGQVRIVQQFEGSRSAQALLWGDPGDPSKVVSASLNVPTWTLEFEPAKVVLQPVAPLGHLLTAFAVALLLLLGGIYMALSSFGRKLEADADTLYAFVTHLVARRPAPAQRYRIPMFGQLAAALAKLAPAEDKADRQSAPPEAGSADKEAEQAADAEGADADDDFLDVGVAKPADKNFGIEVSEEVGPRELGLNLDNEIFRAYDIRGVVDKNLDDDVVYWIGRAFAAEATEHSQSRVAVGRDGRHSSDGLRKALVRGLTEGGMDVVDVGRVPTPMLYFATYALDTGTGIMITGSHNPPEYNGLKMVIAGETLAGGRIQQLRDRLESNSLSHGEGEVEQVDLNEHYVNRVIEDVVVAQPLKVVVDCGNGVAGSIAPRLLEELGCEVVPLYCEVDGDFPNHHPDPADPRNLEDLITVVQAENAELGLAFDGDGDRLGVVTGSGEIIWPDKLMMLFAQDVVSRNPGADIIYDVKCSRHLNNVISEHGGRPIMWKTGHSHIKAKLKATGALLAGEFSGHICFAERWYGFDDAIYSAARLLEIIGGTGQSADELFDQFPATVSTPEIKVQTTEEDKFRIVEQLGEGSDFGDGTVTSIDGVRVDYADGWGLIRASNTSPVLTLRFEADNEDALGRIQQIFRERLAAIDDSLTFS